MLDDIVQSNGHAPAVEPPDIEKLAAEARRARVQRCEEELQDAIHTITTRHRCRLATRQEFVDGVPGPMRLVVLAVD